jgi:hypothetical protein
MNPQTIPQALSSKNQWLVWRREIRGDKETKIPYNAKNGRRGKSNDSRTWCDLSTALKALADKEYSGIGFAFNAGDGLCGIDVDYPWDSPQAQEIIDKFRGTYCERSPSGRLRVFCCGKPQRCGKGTDKRVEVCDFTSPRYLSVTANWIEDAAEEVTDQQESLDWLHERYFKPKEKANGQAKGNGSTHHLPDGEVLAVALRDPVFSKYFLGGCPEGEDDSAYDMGFANKLAFYCAHDLEQMDRLFRRSVLMRGKWEREDYRRRTFLKAIEDTPETYQPRRQANEEETPEHVRESETASNEDQSPDAVLNRFNGQYAVALHGASAVIATLNDQGNYEFYREADLRKLHRGELVSISVPGGIRKKAAFDWWLNNIGRRQHGRIVFRPDTSLYKEGFPDATRTPTLNLWRGLQIAPKAGNHDLISEHIYDVWAARDDARYAYIMDWLAAKFQWMPKKVRTCLVFQGTQGDGKNTIWELVLAPILGAGARMITNCQHVTGRFNAALRGTVLVLLNEAFWGGSHDYEGILKGLITDPSLILEQKHLDPVEVPNYLDLIMFTNFKWAVRVNPGDRRFYITQTSPIHKGNADYFNQLRRNITDEMLAAFLHMLLERDISSFNPEQFPDEHALKLNAKIESLEAHQRFIYELIENLELPEQLFTDALTPVTLIRPGTGLANKDEAWEQKPIDLYKEALYSFYLHWLKQHALSRAKPRNSFFMDFLEMVDSTGRSKRPWDNENGARPRVIALENRAACRKSVAQFLASGKAML